MKQTPQMQRLQEVLRSSKIVAGGFLGSDTRDLTEIIDADAASLVKLGHSTVQIAQRMQELTAIAIPRLGMWVNAGDDMEVSCEDYKGRLVCPWPHPVSVAKRVTTARRVDSGETIRWTDMNIHLIAQHCFFEGRGSAFRIEPATLVGVIF
jgi:hypothetical protein